MGSTTGQSCFGAENCHGDSCEILMPSAPLIKTECLDSSLPAGRRQTQTSHFSIFIALPDSFARYHALRVLEAARYQSDWCSKLWSNPRQIIRHQYSHFSATYPSKETWLGKQNGNFVMCLIYRQDKPKCFLFRFAAFHCPSAPILVYPRCGRRHPCAYKYFQPHSLLVVSHWASPIHSLNFFLQPGNN